MADSRRKILVEADLIGQAIEGVFGRFDGDDSSRRPDGGGQGKRMRSNIGADVDCHGARTENAPVCRQGRWLESSQQIDTEVDPFAQVEPPGDALAPADDDVVLAAQPQPCRD